MTKLKEIFTSWRVILLFVFLAFALVAIHPQLFSEEGVTIRSVSYNSSAANAGIITPTAKTMPVNKERILYLNDERIKNAEDYYATLKTLKENKSISLQTDKKKYTLITKNNLNGEMDLGLKVYDNPRSNIRKGLDLEGGTRVLLKPAELTDKGDLESIVDILKERLNVYGLSDIVVRSASDLAGEDFILIEIAGVTEDEVKELLGKQGKFEAKIGNETVFYGGKKDITYVCKSADCSGIDPRQGCFSAQEGYACNFFFTISLNPEAADRQARLTEKLNVVSENGQNYLSKSLDLYLDDKQVDSLKIGAELKGRASTSIQISGSGTGLGQQQAMANSLQNMKKLQTVLVTGSLPVKLEVVKTDTISPSLGNDFLNNILLVGVLAILGVVSVVTVKYKKFKIIIPMASILVSEVILVMGFAAFVGWNLDLAAIAGVIIVIGTGVNHLIIITDETMKGEATADWKTAIKNALFIIMGAYCINFASMVPLFWAGAGLLKGFALTTIAGMSFGVLIARPAYATMIEILLRD
ncbi:hypothetical protein HYX11_03745 [Candidatus Woesearchaeota archaeon]|nr:hypothetical protein [Candidatus Woesearchaeota archaeon]